MNPLENLKQQLQLKPSVKERNPVIINIPGIEKTKIEIVDKRDQGYNPVDFLERMKKNVSKVVSKKYPEVSIQPEIESKAPQIEPIKKKSIKKLDKQFVILEDEETKEKQEPELETEIEVEIEPKKRRTPKIEKGIVVLGTEQMVQIGDTVTKNRIPKPMSPIDIKVSSYYMNNREIFINFINGLFEPYKEDLLDETKQITCQDIGKDTGESNLLTHQKIVRDYLNLYTPYRGLLLYHGLGSGKCHAKNTPILMYDGSIKMVQDIQVGEELMGDDSNPRCVLSLARGNDTMYKVSNIKGSNEIDSYIVNQEHILCLFASRFPKISCKKNKYYIEWIENNSFMSKKIVFNVSNRVEQEVIAYDFFNQILEKLKTRDNIMEISVRDYLKLSNTKKKILKGYRVPVVFSEKSIPVDPYIIGLSLRNKRSNITEYYNFLDELNMENKHIPMIYKCNSRKNQLRLLAGLMDGNCHFNKKKRYFELFIEQNELLADVMYLVRSLGFTCSKQNDTDKLSVRIYDPLKNTLMNNINVSYVGTDEYFGFVLDGNNRYVMGDFTVTHNTFSSIAIAEGFKSTNKIIVMTPASLKRNYLEEIKKHGDLMYRKNQYWEWISVTQNPETINTLSTVLGLSVSYIQRKQGAWLVNVSKQNNYSELSSSDKKNLDEQLDEMIQNKYTFINYNGLRREKFKQLTNNFENNIFDNAVVIIDEAHNLISRIVNKINKLKTFKDAPRGQNSNLQLSLSLQIYEFLLRANNARIVLLTGTPIINYPNEIGILFNILRGYIKTWQFTLSVETTDKINKETLTSMFSKEKIIDYIDYNPSSKIFTITRNPYGFENKITEKSGYKGVTNERKKDETGKVDERGMISDEEFVKRTVKILKKNNITAISKGTSFTVNTALPDTLDEFVNLFVDKDTGKINNIEKFKKRIIGLTSFFRSAQEELLPRYNKITDFHVIRIPMSNYQFKIYEEARVDERKSEKPKKGLAGKQMDKDGIFIEPTSTYRIFSRLFCNFVMPKPPGRPKPSDFQKELVEEEELEGGGPKKKETKEIKETKEEEENTGSQLSEYKNEDAKMREKDELEGDEVLELLGDKIYQQKIKEALKYLKLNSAEYLTPTGLETYSPKFLAILENITDDDHLGCHLVYSQFRSMEGIGILCIVLEANGFAQFKIKKDGINGWALDMTEEDLGKPTFALYTGTEEAEEREIMRNIYNGTWNYIPTNIESQLKKMSNNNNMGEIIKVFMITAAGSEGINLRNTRYVHLIEPYWQPVRLEQVIGRARRICSHQDLPIELQTVEVFLYLMIFTADQLKSEDAIELKLKDLSKRMPYVPLTSDEKLFEISNIKEELTSQLLKGIKETSIDCAIHIKSSSKENLKCLSFGQPLPTAFSYNPNYSQDENDTVAALNRATVEWQGREFTFNGKKMILREETKQVYDYDSYQQALTTPGLRPILLGRLEKTDGKYRIIKATL